jgi:hypothetical protein
VGMRLYVAVYDETVDSGSSTGNARPADGRVSRLHCVGWANMSLFDELGAAKNGLHDLRLWQDATAPDAAVAPCTINLRDDAYVRLLVQLDCSPCPPRLIFEDGEAVAVDRGPLIALAEGFTKQLKAPEAGAVVESRVSRGRGALFALARVVCSVPPRWLRCTKGAGCHACGCCTFAHVDCAAARRAPV